MARDDRVFGRPVVEDDPRVGIPVEREPRLPGDLAGLIRRLIRLEHRMGSHGLNHEIAGGDTVRLHVRDDGVDTTGRQRTLNFVAPITVSEDTANQEYDIGVATSALDFGEVGDITQIDIGDTAAAGASGEVADAAHQHALTSAITSGIYTPTCYNVANLDATPTANECQYLRIGVVVLVGGSVLINPTTTLTDTQAGIDLPIASDINSTAHVTGTATSPAISGQSAAILGDATNNRATMQWRAADVTEQTMYFSFVYRIL